MLIVQGTATQTVATPAGFHLVAGTGTGPSTDTGPRLWVFWKISTGPYDVTVGPASGPWRIIAAGYRNVDTTTPIGASNVKATTVGSSVTSASLTAPAGGRLLVAPAAVDNALAGAFTAPNGMTSVNASNGQLSDLALFDQAVGAGATGNKSATFNQTASLSAFAAVLNPTTDVTPPAISAQTVTPGIDQATVTWTTNEPASTAVEYGSTTSYSTIDNSQAALTTAHSDTLTGLLCGTTYFFRTRTADPAGNLAASSGSFTTLPCTSGITLVGTRYAASTAPGTFTLPFPPGIRAGDQIVITSSPVVSAPTG